MPKAGQGLKTSRVRDEELDQISWVGNSLNGLSRIIAKTGLRRPSKAGEGRGRITSRPSR